MCTFLQVKAIMGTEFDQTQFDDKKDKETNLLARATLMEVVNSHKEKEDTPHKVGIQLSAATKRHARGRHRSFENSNNHTSPDKSGGNHKKRVPRALSMEAGPEDSSHDKPPQGEVDSWESVQAQPSCAICGMVFTSKGKLDTHVKYSSVHVSNLKKLDTIEKAKMSTPCAGIVDHQEEESARCRVLYTGNKHFWRTQDNLDITIYLHIDAKCLEVIAFEGKANFEFPRIYLDESKIMAMITEKVILEKVAKVVEAENKKKFKKELPPPDILFSEEKRLCESSFILQRLKLSIEDIPAPVSTPPSTSTAESSLVDATKGLLASQSLQMMSLGVSSPKGPGGGGGFSTKTVTYVPYHKDKETNVNFNISSGTVTPVLIKRRRHSTDQEIKDTIHSVEEMQQDIRTITKKAESIANMVHKGVDSFHAGMRSRNELMKTYSKPRQRWIFAINRVLKRAIVRKVRRHVLTFGDKYYMLPPGRVL
jgi:hypothetical protein